MKELQVELEQLRQLIVAMVGREQVGCASGSSVGTVDDKVGEDDERDEGGLTSVWEEEEVTGRRETERKEKGRKET